MKIWDDYLQEERDLTSMEEEKKSGNPRGTKNSIFI